MNHTLNQSVGKTANRPQDAGFIYFATNPSMPGVVKIGCSEWPYRRINQLSATTSTPTPFVLEFSQFVFDMKRIEQTLHAMLDCLRVSPDREFFSIDVDTAVKFFSDWAFPLGLIPIPEIDYLIKEEQDVKIYIPLTDSRMPDKKQKLDYRYSPETVFFLKKKGII